MPRYRNTIAKRRHDERLGVNEELAAAGYLHGFWHEPGMESRRWWHSIAAAHGQRILEKVLEAAPGTRPGFQYAIGIYPPIPLLADAPPPEHMAAREYLDIDGVRFWYCGKYSSVRWSKEGTWLPSQAEHLRRLGELDGAEWKRHLAWRRGGFKHTYVLDGAQHTTVGLMHLCY